MRGSEKPARIPCIVPGCRRTAPDDGTYGKEIICGKHWRGVPLPQRRRYQKLCRIIRREWPSKRARKANRIGAKVWAKIKAEAIANAFQGVEL